jgi:hypothetical protein
MRGSEECSLGRSDASRIGAPAVGRRYGATRVTSSWPADRAYTTSHGAAFVKSSTLNPRLRTYITLGTRGSLFPGFPGGTLAAQCGTSEHRWPRTTSHPCRRRFQPSTRSFMRSGAQCERWTGGPFSLSVRPVAVPRRDSGHPYRRPMSFRSDPRSAVSRSSGSHLWEPPRSPGSGGARRAACAPPRRFRGVGHACRRRQSVARTSG